MLILVAISTLLLTTIGLGSVRTAPAFARWLALLAAIAFVVVMALADRTDPAVVVEQTKRADLAGDAQHSRTAMLLAASAAGPSVGELQLQWQPTWCGAAGVAATTVASVAALGADAVVPPPLPFAPNDVRVRAMSPLRVQRPALFEVEVLGLRQDLVADVVVAIVDTVVVQETLAVGASVAPFGFTPTRAGRHVVSLRIQTGDHEVTVTGNFEVADPDEILVVEPSGIVAAALRVQGERVREVSLWPSDWNRHSRIVLGRALSTAEQQALVLAVHDGTGLFVLPSAFGDAEAPLRELLPIRILPELAAADDGEGKAAGGNGDDLPSEPTPKQPPPVEPSVEPTGSPPVEPPNDPSAAPPSPESAGDTEGNKPLSKDPIEVDKHSIAMVLVIDRSGSMGTRLANGLTKMSYAKASALRTAQALDEGDRVGLVTFGDQQLGIIELPMTDATNEQVVRRGIERLTHRQEYTFLLSGLRQAHGMLLQERAAVKHVVVITDGEFHVGQSPALRREAYLMRSQGKITVSIISIIDEMTDAGFKVKAQEIATDGGGAFIATANVKAVPVIVSTEVTRALSRVGRQPRQAGNGDSSTPMSDPEDSAAPEPPPKPPDPDQPEPDAPTPEPSSAEPQPDAVAKARLQVHAVSDSPLLQPLPQQWPSLGAAVRSEAPFEARVLLVVGDEGWPLLAYANRGLGRVGVFGAELGGEQGREFRSAKGFPGWLAQWLAATSVASEAQQAADLREHGEVVPPAPVPADVRWLRQVAGEPTPAAQHGESSQLPNGSSQEPSAATFVIGREVIAQVAAAAPILLLVLLLLAIAERATSWYALRRGRS